MTVTNFQCVYVQGEITNLSEYHQKIADAMRGIAEKCAKEDTIMQGVHFTEHYDPKTQWFKWMCLYLVLPKPSPIAGGVFPPEVQGRG